jgi:hypothetical protein
LVLWAPNIWIPAMIHISKHRQNNAHDPRDSLYGALICELQGRAIAYPCPETGCVSAKTGSNHQASAVHARVRSMVTRQRTVSGIGAGPEVEASKLEAQLLDLDARRHRVPHDIADDALKRKLALVTAGARAAGSSRIQRTRRACRGSTCRPPCWCRSAAR